MTDAERIEIARGMLESADQRHPTKAQVAEQKEELFQRMLGLDYGKGKGEVIKFRPETTDD